MVYRPARLSAENAEWRIPLSTWTKEVQAKLSRPVHLNNSRSIPTIVNMIWSTAILCLLAWYTLSFIQKLQRNVRIAQRIGLPYVVFPLPGTGILVPVLITTKWARYVVDHCLPASLADAFNDNTFDKRWTARNRQFKRLGPVHVVVNPDGVMCRVGDADVAAYVCNARLDFPKPTWMYSGW